MTRKELVRNLERRIAYHKGKGIIVDIEPEKLSTQRMTYLMSLKGRRFLEYVGAETEADGRVITLKEARREAAEQERREKIMRQIARKTGKEIGDGYSFYDLTKDIGSKSNKELAAIARMPRQRFLEEFAQFTYEARAPFEKSVRRERISGAKAVEVEKARRAAEKGVQKYAGRPLQIPGLYAMAENIDKYIELLKQYASPEYYERLSRSYEMNYFMRLEDLASWNLEIRYIIDEIYKKYPDAKTRAQYLWTNYSFDNGGDIKVYYDGRLSMNIDKLYAFWGITNKYEA